MNENTILYQITETSQFMMGFVLVTKADNVIVIDGGRAEDMPLLKQYIGGRHISAWILTHAHGDHVSGLISEYHRNGLADFDIEKIYYNLPPYQELLERTDVPNLDYFRYEVGELGHLAAIMPELSHIAHSVTQGERVQVDECRIDFIFTYHDGLFSNLLNDSSLVFHIITPNKKVLFLGDLGPEGGDVLYEESRDILKADIVQMPHHGHMNVGMEVYAAIMPDACMWCCADWLYDEPEIPKYLQNRQKLRSMQRERMYGTAVTRKWMDILGVKTHYVTKDGTQKIVL